MIIAKRQLEIREKNTRTLVPIQLFAPIQIEPQHWQCRYEIGWPSGKRVFSGHGTDAFQALLIAMQMIGGELYASTYHKSGKLHSDEQSGGYGFPIAKNCHDLLVGDDKLMF